MKTLFESYVEMQEQLKGKQHKIDKNKNNKIDAHDFKLLRKKEEEVKEAAEPPFDGPYTTTKGNITDKSGAVHSPMSRARDLARKALQQTTKQKKYGTIQGHERFTSIPDKLKQSHFGKTNEEVLDESIFDNKEHAQSIADKLKKKNEDGNYSVVADHGKHRIVHAYHSDSRVKKDIARLNEEVLDETNHRDLASVGMMHPNMAKNMSVGDTMDYYEPKTGDKVHGKVMHKNDTEVHMKQTHDSYDDKKVGSVHKFKIGTGVSEEVDLEEVLKVSDGAGKWISDFVHSENPKFEGKSKKERQQMALGAYYSAKKGVKEEVESIDEISKATIGSYVKKAADDATITRKIASDFEHRAKTSRKQSMKDANTSIANDFQNKSWKRQDNIKKAVDRLTKEETDIEESRGHKIVANFLKKRGAWDTPKKGDDLADKSYLKDKPGVKSDLKNLGRFLTGKKETNEETMKTFKEFAMMLEMEFKDGRYVHKGKYGTSYDDPEGKEDNDSTQAKEPAVKRGRGRPAGAKSGARQLGGASKKGSGVEYTGYKLHLPNSNKSY
jgi:hypothetical protein